jgi:hypothetical protein
MVAVGGSQRPVEILHPDINPHHEYVTGVTTRDNWAHYLAHKNLAVVRSHHVN